MNARDAALDLAACYRLTRLVTSDTITRPLRASVIRFAYERAPGWMGEPKPFEQTAAEWDAMPAADDDAPLLAELVTCRACVSVYAAAFVLVARKVAPALWDPVARLLALSAGASLIGGLER